MPLEPPPGFNAPGFRPGAPGPSLSPPPTGGTPARPRIEFSSARFSARNRATSASNARVYFVLLTRRIHSISFIMCFVFARHPEERSDQGSHPVPDYPVLPATPPLPMAPVTASVAAQTKPETPASTPPSAPSEPASPKSSDPPTSPAPPAAAPSAGGSPPSP